MHKCGLLMLSIFFVPLRVSIGEVYEIYVPRSVCFCFCCGTVRVCIVEPSQQVCFSVGYSNPATLRIRSIYRIYSVYSI
jgi:hypothetical protein